MVETLPSPSAPGGKPTVPPAAPKNWRAAGLVWLGSWLLRLLVLTLRLRVEIAPQVTNRPDGKPFIFVFWHNQLLLIPVVWNRFLNAANRPRGRALTSQSRDGELVALFLDRFGVGAVRGSANGRGAGSLRELAGWLKRGHDIGITPDGSKGPCHEIKPGLVLLGQLSGCSLLPLSFEFSSAWRLKSWDRFFIPKPFSTVKFVAGEPFPVARTNGTEAFEAERLRCERMMQANVQQG